jgi:hypothetical protein
MKKAIAGLLFAILALWALPAFSQDNAFVVSRLVVCSGIKGKEPVDIRDTFSISDRKVYCFLDATDIKEDTSVKFVWYYADRETARIVLPLKKGNRWRTFSSKKLGKRRGQWRVVVSDASGSPVGDIGFGVK